MAILKRILFISVVFSLVSVSGWGISRDSCMSIANSYYMATWTTVAGNCNTTYNDYVKGVVIQGIPYNWGGYESLATALLKLSRGSTAGNFHSAQGIHYDFAGEDCSGYVSECWKSGRYTTSTLPSISTTIPWASLIRGDITNYSGSHVRMVDYLVTGTNNVMFYECTTGVDPGRVTHRILARDNNYIPMRYTQMAPVEDWSLFED